MDFYTSVSIQRNKILVCGYLDGKRYKQEVKYRPYLFLETNEPSEYRTMRAYAKRKDFSSINEARDYLRQFEDVENFTVHGFTKFVYPYINDTYQGTIDYDISQMKIWNLDIETANEHGGFPDIDTANEAITLIGVGLGKKRVIFGYGDYQPKEKRVKFVRCADERDMLVKFLNMWSHDDYRPDIVTGWNIEKFDIPYIVNRMSRVLDEDHVKRLSPWGQLNEKEVEVYGRVHTIYTPVGISVLDYYDLYRKFTYTQLESYTLDHVAFVETGKRKLDYSEYSSLHDLYKNNYEKFVDYNITDIDRVQDIDDKNKFIELVIAIAFDAKVNFVDALTSVLLWDVIIHNYLMEKKIVVPNIKKNLHVPFAGAYVKDVQVGMHDWVVSFDLTSLYPHLIMQYNISPETFSHMEPNWNNEKFERLLTDAVHIPTNLTMAANGAYFSKEKHGFLAELMKTQFQKRVEYKEEMKRLKKLNDPSLERKIAALHNAQMAKKIQLNSAYGALANQWFRYYDWRLASAITISGQLSIRWVENGLNKFLNKLLGTNNVDFIIAADTDSVYIGLDKLLKAGKIARSDDIRQTKEYIDQFCQNVIEPEIERLYKILAKRMNAYENAMHMKREAIANKAIWQAKKRYIANVLNSEGIEYDPPQIKMMGIETVRSSTPTACKEALKKAIKLMIETDEKTVQQFIREFREQFSTLSFEDVAFPRSVNGIDKYSDNVNLYKKGSPIHVKAAIIHNAMLDKYNLTQYQKIYNKAKIKFCYLHMPNPYHSRVIAALRSPPVELGVEQYIDYSMQFEKSFLEPLTSLLTPIGWSPVAINTIEGLFD